MPGAPPEDSPRQAELAERAEEALRESEARFRAIFENSGSGMALVDMAGRPVECNPALQKILGYTEEELRGMAFTEFTHPDDRELDLSLFGELSEGEREKYEIEKRFVTKDGRTIWGNLVVSLVRDAGGAPKYAVGMVQDVTERKRAEEELRRVSERLQLATRAAGIGIWDWDVVQDKLVWDDATYGLFGVRKEDFGGAYDAWAGTLAPEDFERITADVRAALRGEREYDTEFRVIWPDGSVHYLKADGQVFWDEAGRPLRMVGVNYDITERKQAEEVAKAGEERLSLAFEAAGIGTGELDLESNKISLSHPMQRVLGLAPGTVNLTLEEYVELAHPEDRASVSQAVESAIADRTDIALDYRIVWPEGTVHWVTSRARVFYDEAGKARRIIGALTDITERKLAEDEVRRQKEVFQKIFDNAPIALNFFSEDGRLLMVNRAWERIFGWTLKEVEEGNIDIFAEAMTGPRETEWVREFVSAAGGQLADFKIKRKDGTTVDLLGAVVGLSDGTRIGIAQDITERKRAEQELRLSEERFAKAFHASPEASTIHRHRDGVFLEVNERWLSIYGYTREEVIGRSTKDMRLSSPEVRDKLRQTLQEQGSLRDYEIALMTKQGEIRQVSLSAEMFVINGETCSIYLQLDITERKRAEEENRRLIHSLGERVKELTALHHTARILQDESNGVPELLQKIVELLPAAWQYPEVAAARINLGGMEFKTKNYAPSRWSQVAEFETAGTQGAVEVVYLEERPAEYAGPFLLEERNLINSLAELLRSALDRRHAQGALRESEERFRQLTDNVREVLWLYEPDYAKALYISPAYESVWGRTRESLYRDPESFLDAVHADDRARVEETIRRERGRGYGHEYRIVRSDGAVRWIWDRAFPIKDRGGQVYRIAGIAEDITERKKAEEQLLASREQLRALSESLRRAKEEEGVRIARELHDELGASLSSLKWGLEEIGEDVSESAGAPPPAALREKIAGMITLTDTAVDAVRRIASELRPVALEELGLAAAVRWHAQQFQALTGIAVNCDCPAESADLNQEQATAVFRIFQEALTNVLRHAGATRVDVKLNSEAGHFVLTVGDNGRGITEAEKMASHSLGLLGMRERAHMLGGEITIEAPEGRGTVVTVRVPLTAKQAGPEA